MDKRNSSITLETKDVDKALIRALERGINDVETGRELSLETAMKRVEAIRQERKQIRA